MYTSVSGFYENGQVFFTEPLPIQTQKVDVIVTFLDEKSVVSSNLPLLKGEIRFGSLKGRISIPDDFNEPLDDLKEYM